MTELLEPNDSRSEEQDTPQGDYSEEGASLEEDEDLNNNLSNEEEESCCDPDVLEILSHCAAKGTSFLDLSRRKLQTIPQEILLLDRIQVRSVYDLRTSSFTKFCTFVVKDGLTTRKLLRLTQNHVTPHVYKLPLAHFYDND